MTDPVEWIRPAAPVHERADAARNRRRVLEAAERLFTRQDPSTVTMAQIAREAGVGKGTLYRRYPDTTAVAVALLDDHERELQQQLLHGPPPLGPGATPAQRLEAFYAAMLVLLSTGTSRPHRSRAAWPGWPGGHWADLRRP